MEVTASPHSDTISKVCCGQSLVLTTSWDSTAVLSDYNGQIALRAALDGPLMSGCFSSDERRVYVGGTEKRVAMVDIDSGKICGVGSPFSAPVAEVCSNGGSEWGLVAVAQDGHLQAIDSRQPGGISYNLLSKVICADTAGTYLVLGLEDRSVRVFDLRQLSKPLFTRKLNLEHPIARIRCSPEGKSYAASSLASRIVIEKMDPHPSPTDYVFRAHRETTAQGCTAHGVFGLAFHPTMSNVLATGGTDRSVSIWDLTTREQKLSFSNLLYEVSSLDFNPSGGVLAVATSCMPYLSTASQTKTAHPSTLVLKRDFAL